MYILRLKVLAFNALLLVGVTALAQPEEIRFDDSPFFTRFGYEQGYPEPVVLDMHQDSLGFIWIATADGLFRYDGYEFREFRADPNDENSIAVNIIYQIQEAGGQLILNCQEHGLSVYDQTAGNFQVWSKSNGKLPVSGLKQLLVDHQGNWWATSEEGLIFKSPQMDAFEEFHLPVKNSNPFLLANSSRLFESKDGHIWLNTDHGILVYSPEKEIWNHLDSTIFRNNTLATFHEDPLGRIWLGGSPGLYHFDKGKKSLVRVGEEAPMKLSHQNVRSIQYGPDDRLWVGTMNGLNALDLIAQTNEVFTNNPETFHSLSKNRVSKLFLDQQGLLWVGTWGGAVQYIDFQKRPFKTLSPPFLSHGNVNVIFEKDHELWVGFEDGGLNKVDLKTGERELIDTLSGLSTDKVYSIEYWEDRYWIGMGNGNAINSYDPLTQQVDTYNGRNSDLPDMTTWAMAKDLDGHLWLGMDEALVKLSGVEANNRLIIDAIYRDTSVLPSTNIRSLLIDSKGNLWIGTSDFGLISFQPTVQTYTTYNMDAGEGKKIPGNYINCIFEDSKGRIWIGTPFGAAYIDQPDGRIVTITEADGLPNNYVFKIMEDDLGDFWISTNRGLVQYIFKEKAIKVFTRKEGIFNNEFNQSAGFQSAKTLYFGTTTGILALKPEDIPDNKIVPPVVFTKVVYRNKKANNKPIEIKGISKKKVIKLGFRDEFIEINFAALNYYNSQKNQYRYRLQGASQQWFDLGNKNYLTLVDLDPGTYELQVQGSNNDGKWNEAAATLKIIITPPFWSTRTAKFIYVFCFIGLLYLGYLRAVRRKLARAEETRKQELDKAKTRFFTNIAHEFKTPLTVILGVAGEWKGSEKNRTLLMRSINNMRNLTNQVLELSRLENNQLPVRYAQHNIVELVQNTIETYHSIAEQKKVKISFESSSPIILMDVDHEKWLRIFSNLLSNAIKYNEENGSVFVSLQEKKVDQGKWLQLEVRDTGLGIPAAALPKIFDRFYQVDETSRTVSGTGVGLALTKELVKLMNGQINVESEIGVGSTFTVFLPITNEATLIFNDTPKDEALTYPLLEGEIGEEEKTTVLLIEDNPDITTYLTGLLEKDYTVSQASDGEIGIAVATEEVPDIIISDVMMPKKDGFEVLHQLKNDPRTSHIPIVLLTAKAEISDRLQGLEQGADVYLGKPFNPDELQAQIRSLLLNRRRVQAFLREKIQNPEANMQGVDPFVGKVRQVILDNLDQEEFNVSDLCQQMNVSRTQLHNKLKATTGKSTTHFVNEIKVSEGKKLLLSTDMTISEVAYEVGFKDPNYFSQCYKAVFGVPPSEARK